MESLLQLKRGYKKRKAVSPGWGNGLSEETRCLLIVSHRAKAGIGDRDLRVALIDGDGRIGFARDRGDITDVVVRARADEVGVTGGGYAFVQEVLLGGGRDLAEIIGDSLDARLGAHFAEGGNSHRGQEADDDYDDHNFNEGETLASGFIIHDKLS